MSAPPNVFATPGALTVRTLEGPMPLANLEYGKRYKLERLDRKRGENQSTYTEIATRKQREKTAARAMLKAQGLRSSARQLKRLQKAARREAKGLVKGPR